MIIKHFELSKINNCKAKIFLLYGQNEGFKTDITKKYFIDKFKNDIFRYDEKEILENKSNFFNGILSKSFFEEKKLFIISRVTDKLVDIIEEVLEKEIKDITIVLNASILDKKTKLRKLFEKSKDVICVPVYEDNSQTLSVIARDFFKINKILISQETINLLIERSRGDRGNLINELKKIESYMKTHKNISSEEILKLTDLAENYNVSELLDNCLCKNSKKTINILNENKYGPEDCILIIRSLLSKSKRLLKLNNLNLERKNLDDAISSYKPPIFWKEKDIVKKQVLNWKIKDINELIYKIGDIEILIKKNFSNSLNILSDFIITQSNTNN